MAGSVRSAGFYVAVGDSAAGVCDPHCALRSLHPNLFRQARLSVPAVFRFRIRQRML